MELSTDDDANCTDTTIAPLLHLHKAADIDVSVTLFTNPLPIRRLSFTEGQSAEIKPVYFVFGELTAIVNHQLVERAA